MKENYNVIFYNGEYLNTSNFSVSFTNRAFRYGDGLFETMHSNGGEVQLFDKHMERFRKGLNILKIPLCDIYTNDYIKQVIKGVLHRCRLYQGATIRMSVWRDAQGKFMINTTGSSILIEASFLNEGKYILNTEGIVLGLFNEPLVGYNMLSAVKSSNSLPYIMAGAYANNNGYDDVLMINYNGNITEATSSNVFALKNNIVYTPELESGCLPGVMRAYVIKILNEIGFEYREDIIKPNFIETADEVFLTNAISGIRWCVAYNNRRFLNRLSKKLITELNNRLIPT